MNQLKESIKVELKHYYTVRRKLSNIDTHKVTEQLDNNWYKNKDFLSFI